MIIIFRGPKFNDLLFSLQSSTVSVIDVSKHFEAENGEVLFVDEQGRQLYHDATHLSDYGTERIRDILMRELNTPSIPSKNASR